MSKAASEISGHHDFTVLGATEGFDKIVEVDDVQCWHTPDAVEPGKPVDPGKIRVTNRAVPYWDNKDFFVDAADKNLYVATGTDIDGSKYRITLLFERARHMTSHSEVWMMFGSRSIEGVLTGPPNWGGQNEN